MAALAAQSRARHRRARGTARDSGPARAPGAQPSGLCAGQACRNALALRASAVRALHSPGTLCVRGMQGGSAPAGADPGWPAMPAARIARTNPPYALYSPQPHGSPHGCGCGVCACNTWLPKEAVGLSGNQSPGWFAPAGPWAGRRRRGRRGLLRLMGPGSGLACCVGLCGGCACWRFALRRVAVAWCACCMWRPPVACWAFVSGLSGFPVAVVALFWRRGGGVMPFRWRYRAGVWLAFWRPFIGVGAVLWRRCAARCIMQVSCVEGLGLPPSIDFLT